MLLDSILGIGNKLIDKLIPDPEAKAKAQMDLAKMAQDGELAKMANETKLYEVEQTAITDRWQADMGSDSWLSKNIRPMALIRNEQRAIVKLGDNGCLFHSGGYGYVNGVGFCAWVLRREG